GAGRFFRLEWFDALVVGLEPRVVVVLVVRLRIGGHDLEDVVLEAIRLQRAVAASDQARFQESAPSGVVVPALELILLEEALKFRGFVRRDVEHDGRVFPAHPATRLGSQSRRIAWASATICSMTWPAGTIS